MSPNELIPEGVAALLAPPTQAEVFGQRCSAPITSLPQRCSAGWRGHHGNRAQTVFGLARVSSGRGSRAWWLCFAGGHRSFQHVQAQLSTADWLIPADMTPTATAPGHTVNAAHSHILTLTHTHTRWLRRVCSFQECCYATPMPSQSFSRYCLRSVLLHLHMKY